MTDTLNAPAPATPAAAARDAILEALQEALNQLDGLPDAEFSLDFDGDGDEEGTIRITHNGEEIDDAVLDTRRALTKAQDVAKQALDGLPQGANEEQLQAAFNAGWNRACRAIDEARMWIQHYHSGTEQRLACRDDARREAGY